MPRSLIFAVGMLFAMALGCGGDSATPPVVPDELGRCADFDPLRKPLWGDPHIHTTLSLDANLQGTRTTSKDA